MVDKKHHNITKQVIIEYEDNGLTISEIAQKLNIPKKQVEKIINENCNIYEE